MSDLSYLLLQAIEAERGIKVHTNNMQLLRNKLYAERKKMDEFRILTFIPSPASPETEIWIIKKECRHGAQES